MLKRETSHIHSFLEKQFQVIVKVSNYRINVYICIMKICIPLTLCTIMIFLIGTKSVH